jgi:(p)ppGpp synthase/HD superfamily hydrolase
MSTDASEAAVVLGRKFARAVEWACSLHAAQAKKGTNVPYAAHVLTVAALVLEDGGSRTEAIAALLHDAIEDTDATRKEIRRRQAGEAREAATRCFELA